MWPAFLLASAVTAPALGYHTAASSQKGVGGQLQPWQGLLHATAIVFATLVARFSIYDILRLVLGSRPSEGLLLGVLVLVGVGGCVPLFVAHYSKWREGKRLLVMAATCGILFVLLRPPLPLQVRTATSPFFDGASILIVCNNSRLRLVGRRGVPRVASHSSLFPIMGRGPQARARARRRRCVGRVRRETRQVAVVDACRRCGHGADRCDRALPRVRLGDKGARLRSLERFLRGSVYSP